MDKVETVVIGGGQAGLAVSYCLAQRDCEHIVLEQAAQAGHAWRTDRWDSFTLNTPNWTLLLPGAGYQGDDPDGFLSREGVVAYLERYARTFRLPVRYDTQVLSVETLPGRPGYRVTVQDGQLEAANVVVATGLYQRPNVPASAAGLPATVLQLASGQYRTPQALPPGGVLVVGSAQSGCQIAEELVQAGRQVFLATGSAGRVPRRYRGRDIFYWLNLVGFFDRPADKLPSARARFAGNPHISGTNGGHTINLHQFARDGLVLLGHLQGTTDKIYLAADLMDNLARADKLEADIVPMIDEYIARNGIQAPEERLPQLRDGYAVPVLRELDLRSAGIRTIIWAIGYRFDFSLVRLPILDVDGFPSTQRGVTAFPGLYFAGLPWLPAQKSGLFLGVGENAASVADHISARA